jgi:hypothetical protein
MTELGLYLARKSASKAEISRKTGISKSRISELTLNPAAQLRAKELYLIALSVDVDPCELLREVCGHLKLETE